LKVALITACYGAYDPIHALPENHGYDDAVLVTDYPYSATEAPGWRVVIERRDEHPRLAAKRPKMMPWLFTDCDAAVWLDASFEIVNPAFSQWTRDHLNFNDFIVWLHPEGRIDIRQEVEVCWFFDKYKDYPLREQLAHYVADGMPENWGLFAGGTVGYRFTDGARGFGERWYAENVKWSIQDQVSLPYLLWDSGKRFGLWQANEYQNDYLRLRWDERPNPQL
jgi:hypothetical protein